MKIGIIVAEEKIIKIILIDNVFDIPNFVKAGTIGFKTKYNTNRHI